GHADQADHGQDASGDDREKLLRLHAQAERVVDLRRRQQAEEMAEEQAEDADMEQNAAPDQLLAPEKLARLAAPGVLAAIEAGPAAQEEDGHADVGVDAEQEAFEVIHGSTPRGSSGAVHWRRPLGRGPADRWERRSVRRSPPRPSIPAPRTPLPGSRR